MNLLIKNIGSKMKYVIGDEICFRMGIENQVTDLKHNFQGKILTTLATIPICELALTSSIEKYENDLNSNLDYILSQYFIFGKITNVKITKYKNFIIEISLSEETEASIYEQKIQHLEFMIDIINSKFNTIKNESSINVFEKNGLLNDLLSKIDKGGF